MTKKCYIAYGSNLNIKQMRNRCPNAEIFGAGELDGYELLFKGSKTGAYLTIEKKEGSKVPFGVWKVDALDEKSLDRYEGYPSFYYKTEMQVKVRKFRDDAEVTVNAFVYIMHEDRKIAVPDRYYTNICAEGYEDFNFNFKALDVAFLKSLEVCKHGN